MLRPDAERGQARDREQGNRLADPGDAVRNGCGGIPGDQPGGFCVPIEGGVLRLPGLQHPHVCFGHRGKQCRAGEAVRHVRGSADDAGQAVDGAQLRVGKRDPAQQAAHGHVRSCPEVGAIGKGGAQARRRVA